MNARTQPTLASLRAAAEALPGDYYSEPKYEIINLVGSAEDNANDTIYAEGRDEDWEDVAIRTLASLLSERSTSTAARDFFDAFGVAF